MLSPLLSRCLATGRASFNARVAEMRQRQPGLDSACFAGFLADTLDPLAQAVDAHDPERSLAFVDQAYDVALTLVAQGLAGAGARLPWVDPLWREVLPRCAPVLATAPTEVLGSLSNAVVQLASVDGVRVAQWLQDMQASVGLARDLPQLRAIALLQAWRAGMAHYRSGALQAAAVLPEPARLAVLQAAADRPWPQVLLDHQASPWWDEARAGMRTEPVQVGDFSGFGGSFAQPPQVRARGDGFVARSGDRHVWLTADAHGAVLLPATAAEFESCTDEDNGEVRVQGSQLHTGRRSIALDLPADGVALACTTHTIAVTSPYTHRVLLVPREA